jgi:hypothetical protein
MNPIFCIGCSTKNSPVTLEACPQQGQGAVVCPKCERVFSPHLPAGSMHFATERGYRRMLKQIDETRRGISVYTRAMVARILRPEA